LSYYGGKPLDSVPEFVDGMEYNIQIIGFAVDTRAMAMLVKLPENVNFTGKIPHITFALSPGTPPAYSSTLLTNAKETKSIIPLDLTFKSISKRFLFEK